MGLQLREEDASFASHQSFYDMAEKEEVDIQVLENVPEYSEQTVKDSLSHGSSPWEVQSEVLGPRLFGQSASRPRRYLICYRKDKVKWDSPLTFPQMIMALRTCPRMDSIGYFWKKLAPSHLSPAQEQGLTSMVLPTNSFKGSPTFHITVFFQYLGFVWGISQLIPIRIIMIIAQKIWVTNQSNK